MRLSKRILVIGASSAVIALGGVVLAAGGSQGGATSLQNMAGSSTLLTALGEPSTDLSVTVESNKPPKVNFKINGHDIPTDKPGVTPFNNRTGESGSVNGQVVTSGDGNNVSLNANSQNSTFSVSSSTTPGSNSVTNQNTTTSSFNNSFSSISSSSEGSSSNYSSSTVFNNGQFQQNP